MHNRLQWLLIGVTLVSVLNGVVALADDSKVHIEVFAECDGDRKLLPPLVVPKNLTQDEYYNLACRYAGVQWPNQAMECINRIDRKNPKSPLAIKVVRLEDTVLPKEMPPEEAIELNLKAVNRWRNGVEARALADECIRKYPNLEYGYMIRGHLDALDGKHSSAADHYRRALEINPHNTKALDALGDLLLSLKQPQEAKAAFQKAVLYDPEDSFAQNRLELMPRWEKQLSMSPFEKVQGVVSNVVSLISLPVVFALRDTDALKTSGFIDKSGKFMFHRLNTVQSSYYFSHGFWFNSNHFVDRAGKPLGNKQFNDAEDFSEGLAAVCEESNQSDQFGQLWGYLDPIGKYAVQPQFQFAASFREGLGLVKKGGRWGFVDRTGKWIVPPKFDSALPFSDGLAAVEVGGKIGYIDHHGKMVITPKYDVAKSFSDGLAIVTILETEILRRHERCIDKSGKVVFDITALKQKIEGTRENPYCGVPFIFDLPDVLVAKDARDDNTPSFSHRIDPERYSEGLMLMVIHCGKKFGYVDRFGHLVIPCKFDFAQPFKEGLACAGFDQPSDKKGFKLRIGYIDKTGEFVIQPRFRNGNDFQEGLAAVADMKGGGGFIDHAGKIVLPIPGGHCGNFHDGLAAVGEQMLYP